jgi:hypothetical protein
VPRKYIIDNLINNYRYRLSANRNRRCPDACNFNPRSLVGTTINCTETGQNVTISSGAAILTQAMWDGPQKSDNSSLWPGLKKGTLLSSTDTSAGGTLGLTTCSDNGACAAAPLSLLTGWMTKFVLKNDSVNLSKLSRKD